MKGQWVYSNYQPFKDFLRRLEPRGHDPEQGRDRPLSRGCDKNTSRMMSDSSRGRNEVRNDSEKDVLIDSHKQK